MFKIIKRFKILLAVLIIGLFVIFLLSRGIIYSQDELEYGVTFSAAQAESLGLDWQETYRAVLDDLGVKKLRLSAYWDEIESLPGEYNYRDLDYQVEEAGRAGADVILAVGARLPRWPECHYPGWAESLGDTAREEKTLEYIATTINRYRTNGSISAWQVENEPFLSHFGVCPAPDKDFLDREIALVHSLDSRPVVLTDSGELSVWVPAAERADIFGTTMYRDTYSAKLKSYIHYPIEPGFFRFKTNIVRLFAHPEKWLVIELQAEPWGPVPFQELSKAERDKTMNLEKFREILEFSRQAGFREFYLWGVEWWYWEWRVNGDDSLWREAKTLF